MNAPVHFDPASDAYTMPLDEIDVSDPRLFQNDIYYPYFERLRREDPVHYRADGMYGSFWSVTKFKDIMAVETHPEIYSSEAKLGGISASPTGRWSSAGPASSRWIRRGMTTSARWSARSWRRPTSTTCRASSASACARCWTDLPRGETFDWVQRVSIELTTLMLTTLFDFPVEERSKLTYWSDCATQDVNAGGIVDSEEKRLEILAEALRTFTAMWHERAARAAGFRPDLDARAWRGDEEPGQ